MPDTPAPAPGGDPPPGRPDPFTAARDILARRAEAEYPGWQVTHGLYGWTAVRTRDQRTLHFGDLPGLRALMSVAGR